MGTSEYWAELGEWSATVGSKWTHERDLERDPLRAGECICSRRDCVSGMYQLFKQHRKKDMTGGGGKMEIGQSSRTGRYPLTGFQVRLIIHESAVVVRHEMIVL